jgi:hypothetical protein
MPSYNVSINNQPTLLSDFIACVLEYCMQNVFLVRSKLVTVAEYVQPTCTNLPRGQEAAFCAHRAHPPVVRAAAGGLQIMTILTIASRMIQVGANQPSTCMHVYVWIGALSIYLS